MALFKLTKEYFENLALTTHPRREFYSASQESSSEPGMFGTVNVFAQRSDIEKEAYKLRAFGEGIGVFEDNSVETFRQDLVASSSDEDEYIIGLYGVIGYDKIMRHTPIKPVDPGPQHNSNDNKGLLAASIQSDNPTIFIEHKSHMHKRVSKVG